MSRPAAPAKPTRTPLPFRTPAPTSTDRTGRGQLRALFARGHPRAAHDGMYARNPQTGPTSQCSKRETAPANRPKKDEIDSNTTLQDHSISRCPGMLRTRQDSNLRRARSSGQARCSRSSTDRRTLLTGSLRGSAIGAWGVRGGPVWLVAVVARCVCTASSLSSWAGFAWSYACAKCDQSFTVRNCSY